MADRAMATPVMRGALTGVALVVPIVVLTSVVDPEAPDAEVSAWRIPLFFVLLAAFGVAGAVAGRAMPDARFTVGILAGLGTFAAWLPLRALIWAVRDDDRGLFAGTDAVLRPGQLFTAALFACALGLLGGLVGGGRTADAEGGTRS